MSVPFHLEVGNVMNETKRQKQISTTTTDRY